MQEYVMGNGAIALGALAAGVNLVAGYPGTPSSEIVETISRYPHEGVHLEWSVNEKAAMEVAAGAAYSGARALVTMKQVGLNVAADPLLSLAYVGVKGGMVIVSADDPGPISSQTEQDTRRFADFCRIPVFDPSSPEEAYQMIQDAFRYSEKYKTPVLFRPTTRVCHAYANIENPEYKGPKEYEGFQKDSKKWVIFPKLSYASHARMEERNVEIGKDFSQYAWNKVEGSSSEKAIIASGISYAYAKEYLKNHEDIRLIKIATAYPFPEDFVRTALEGVKEVICLEELSPYIEEQVLKLAGRYKLSIKVSGKLDGKVPHSCAGTAGTSSGVMCRMSASCIVLCCKAGDEGKEILFLRRYRMLYAGKCHAAGYGGYLPLYGSRHYHGTGIPLDRWGRYLLWICRGFHIFRLWYDWHCKCCL